MRLRDPVHLLPRPRPRHLTRHPIPPPDAPVGPSGDAPARTSVAADRATGTAGRGDGRTLVVVTRPTATSAAPPAPASYADATPRHQRPRVTSWRRAREWRHERHQQKVRRARHNHFDAACTYWYGDLRPDRRADPAGRNRDFGGASTPIRERRCPLCRPFTDSEADDLLTTAASRELDVLTEATSPPWWVRATQFFRHRLTTR